MNTRTIRLPVPTRRALVVAWLVVGAVLAGAAVYLIMALVQQSNELDALTARADQGRADRKDLRADSVEQQAALDKANARLVDAGKAPVIPPTTLQPNTLAPQPYRYVPIPGPRGLPGLPGGPGMDGRNGDDGEPGAPSTIAGPAGPAGVAGKDGTNGTNGTNGSNGQNATSQQIADAIAAYCSVNACIQGEQGPKGDTGAEGPAGATGPQGPQGEPGAPGLLP